MGLCITAYRNAKLVDKPARDERGLIIEDLNLAIVELGNDKWVQADDLVMGQVYKFEKMYSRFNISCSEFGKFRNELARVLGYPAVAGEPERRKYLAGAWEQWDNGVQDGELAALLNFADNQGEIGNKTCRKILSDFEKMSVTQNDLSEEDNERLILLMATFKHAADGGFVQFH